MCIMKDKHSFFLQKAAHQAHKSNCVLQRHGCVLVHNNKIVAEGYNHVTTYLCHVYSIHAEADAISKIKHDKKLLSKCDLYVARIGKDSMGNPLKLSKPCESCEQLIHRSGIRKVYYSSSDT